ncbi:MAG TPA: pyridoxal phosphate-dependent aminotransferase [Bacteroidales bacterium]|jgi:aspartate aminotransferase|nr:pyridoxal phosphate-dependent aminotransferase [Bacteroidales bacterium]HKM11795.1 pyridoxal phosphate-dependent aminotransferase [Bacteroidales bacterium]HPB89673.1 pyridoxal phosphate-dependent aminotransferase [Bacteroidales bacterium]HPY22491.1 pyridoxal phosphate-dependent aminotransferase [Bacteroidales bacterium]HQA93533.1 pyridoxal phosphate-dependent aminotransferase [Bacteroidales bacterium]
MLTLSEKAKKMPASPIRKLVPYADAAKKRGIKVYHLNIGQPDIPSPKEALDAVKNNQLKLVAYPNSAGNKSLLEGLVKYYKGINIDIDTSCINITNGGSEALQIALAATCNPDDEVIVFEPFYTNYNTFALQNDVVFKPITTKIEEGFALPRMSEVEKKITPRTKGILICNPGNPTGCLYSKEALMELGAIAKKHQLFIYTDEVYREFCYTDEPHFSCMHIPGLEENVILIDSVSKRYSLCGVRIGFIVSKNKEVMKAVLRFAQARLCSPAYGQIAAEGALDAPAEYFKKVRDEYIHRRDVLLEGLNKIKGVVVPKPMGAFYVVAQLPVDDSDKFAQWLLEEFEYEGQTVMVAPLAGFYATKGLGTNQIRMAYVLKEEDLKAALKCLEIALEKYPGRVK